MSLVLAIEPDAAQAHALREVLHGNFGAQLTVVTSKDDAVEAIEREMPDLLLVSALLSPREEQELVAHLRALSNAAHLQLLTIPRLGRAEVAAPQKSSLFGFSKKRTPALPPPSGCDPSEFAEQVAAYLTKAREVRTRPKTRPSFVAHAAPAVVTPPPLPQDTFVALPIDPPMDPPFAAYEPAPPTHLDFDITTTSEPLTAAVPDEPLITLEDIEAHEAIDRIDAIPSTPLEPLITFDEPALAAPSFGDGTDDEVEKLIRQLGIESAAIEVAEMAPDYTGLVTTWRSGPTPPPAPQPTPAAPAVDLSQIRADAEAKLAAELERVQLDATQRREQEMAQWQAETELLREAALGRARADAEAQAREALAAELARVQAEAAQRREAELAQWQAETEALRESTVGRARAEAESEAREALTAELAKVRSETEKLRSDEIARLHAEAEERLEAVTRQARQVAETEAARAFSEEISRVRAESEAAASRALDEEVARVHAAADARLQEELTRVRLEAEQARLAEHSEAQRDAERIREAAAREAREVAEATARRALDTEIQRVRAETEARLAKQTDAQVEAEKIREAAAREARLVAEAAATRTLEAEVLRVRAEAEAQLKTQMQAQLEAEKTRESAAREARLMAEEAANRTLQAEIERVRAEADQRLASELSQLRVEAERRRVSELDEIRKQVAEMREAAAQQARAAAEEAIAAEVARVSSQRAEVAPQHRAITVVSAPAPKTPVAVAAKEPAPAPAPATVETPQPSSSYYDLWRSEGSEPIAPQFDLASLPSLPSRMRKTRWALPVAASLLLLITGSVTVDTTGWGATARSAIVSALPARSTPEPVAADIAAPVTGNLLVETTPKGAKVLVDGTLRGRTPITVSNLSPGRHKLVLESNDGVVIRRDVTIRVGERAVSSELLVTGWLSVSSRLPVDIQVNGRRVGSSNDGQVALSPGRQKVTFVNQRYNVRETQTIEIQAGNIKSHTVTLSPGRLNVNAPTGAEVWVDGQRIGDAPMHNAPVALGTHEVVIKHPDFGEHRQAVEVRRGEVASVSAGSASDAAGNSQSFDGLKVLSESAANPKRQVRPGSAARPY